MPEREPGHMIGGYASGTLTDDERRLLFDAALRDQDVFDALAEDQALKELLDDPVTRRRLVDAMQPAATTSARGWLASAGRWLTRPSRLALAGSLATALLVSVVVLELHRQGFLRPPAEVPSSSPRKADRPATEAAPAVSEQEAEPDRALSSPKPSPPKNVAPRRAGAWHVTQSFGEQSQRGPARSLFFAGQEDTGMGSAGGALEERTAASLDAPDRDRAFRRSEPAAAVAPLGLRYRIVDRQAGAVTSLEPGALTRPRASLALRIEVNQSGYLYVLEQLRDGGGRLLFPEPSSGGSEVPAFESRARVQPGMVSTVALGDRLASFRDEGPYRVVTILRRRPFSEPVSSPAASLVARLLDEVRRTRQTESLVTEQVGGEDGATYVVTPSTSLEAAVVVTLSFEPR